MTARDNDPLHAAINARLAQIAAASLTPLPWQEAWVRLGPQSTEEERLAVYRAVRDAGSVPEDAAFYLVSWQLDVITLERAGAALRAYEDRLEAIRCGYGLGEDECWPPGEGPPEYQEAERALHDAWDALYAATLEEFDEDDLARLLRENRPQFDKVSEAGRQFFHSPRPAEEAEDPDWLDSLLEAVAGCVDAECPMGPLGLRYLEEDGFWEVSIYPRSVELVGGAHDGAVVVAGFSLDLEGLRAAFESVAAFGWNALGLNDPEGPHVYIEGIFQERAVFLRVLAQAPEDEDPGLKLDATNRPHPPE